MPTADAMTYFWRKNKLEVEFQNVTPWWENATATYSWSLANWYVSLHTADPTEGGAQTTNEANFAVLGRAAMARSAAGADVVGTDPANPYAANKLTLLFGKNTTGAPIDISHIGIGSAASGAGKLCRVIAVEDGPFTIPINGELAIAAGKLKIWER